METPTPQDLPDAALVTEEERRQRVAQNWWYTLGVLYRWRRFIIGFTGVMAVASVIISLLLPVWYKSSTRLLLPEGGGGLSAALGSLSSVAQSLLGGGGGDYIRYMAILSSRTVYEKVVDRFNLAERYDLMEAENPRALAIQMLGEKVDLGIDIELNYMFVSVEDMQPDTAAMMANYMVELLNTVNGDLASQSARMFREYTEQRYGEAQAALDSVLDATQAFQQQYGVYDLTAQTETFFAQLAELRTQTLQAEIQYEVLHAQYGAENPRVRTAQQVVRTAEQNYQEALAGAEQLLPVPQGEVPTLIREYVDLERERILQRTILEVITPIMEQARFEEERSVEAVQIVDPAIAPVEKYKPRRSLICILMTFSAGLLAIVFVVVYDWWQRKHTYFAQRFNKAVVAQSPDRV